MLISSFFVFFLHFFNTFCTTVILTNLPFYGAPKQGWGMEQCFSSFQFLFVRGVAKRSLIYYIQFRSFAYCTLDDDVQS
ncbi:hypothetical protein IscW_ISCW024735 [Ixodes scapularis]|uniref:Uncharacterized protein n=1 Tax=Ixodes scapularis TaxID=6945 RepID=B7QEW4_IXOSC|nr:hypothetical protein IscW_ISCW024735 [Ixodes scapularis]|eukprot:XP_002414078.1 hypothetical protein IscW_ISCW024735 [Ixodes scapularis]